MLSEVKAMMVPSSLIAGRGIKTGSTAPPPSLTLTAVSVPALMSLSTSAFAVPEPAKLSAGPDENAINPPSPDNAISPLETSPLP